ncbi:hypothetical protein [Salinisphaera sp. Q1T1-3]|uniref:hypothetical protein n=1 Tax=Salinisphaera sp. Q1T1-3 TaxID=2321229 RepID=UPI001F28F7E5|nr:hypothetical protein [Salinisphaera sp. Q1T1-3]
MRQLTRTTLCIAVLGLTMLGPSGCATWQATGSKSGDTETARSDDPLGHVFANESRRDKLNDGYSALHKQLRGLSQVDRIFYVKIESDDVQNVVGDLTDYSGQLADRLEKLAEQFPAMNLKRTTTPPIIDDAHTAQRNGTLKRFAPLVGQSGAAFERGVLLRLLGVADQERYLTQVLAEQEPNPALSKIMQDASTHFADLFDEINALLDKRFYRH